MDGGKLRLSKYSLAYRQRLLAGGVSLNSFLRGKFGNWPTLLKEKTNIIDLTLEAYASYMHEHRAQRRGALQTAKHGVLLMQVLRPQLRHKLPQTWSTLKAWEEQEPSKLRAPMPIVILMGLLCQARVNSELSCSTITHDKWMDFSVLLAVGFFGLLRPGELIQLRKKDVCLPNNLSLCLPRATLCIQKPKNFRHLGHQQFSTIKQAPTCEWLAWLCSKRDVEDLLWSYSASEFRRLIQICSQALHLKNGLYSPGSLRAGGATFMFDEEQDVGRLKFQGRWANVQSLEHYVQSAKANQLMQDLKQKTVRKLHVLLEKGSFLLQMPAKLLKQIPAEHRLTQRPWLFNGPIWKACREWGRFEEEISKSSDTRRQA